jgi:hypothetical protein
MKGKQSILEVFEDVLYVMSDQDIKDFGEYIKDNLSQVNSTELLTNGGTLLYKACGQFATIAQGGNGGWSQWINNGLPTYPEDITKKLKELGKIIELLLDNKADPKIAEKNNFTPLHAILYNQRYTSKEIDGLHLDLITKLLEKGANPNLAEKIQGNTPLHCACVYNLVEATTILLKFGASRNIQNRSGETPLQMFTDEEGAQRIPKEAQDDRNNSDFRSRVVNIDLKKESIGLK